MSASNPPVAVVTGASRGLGRGISRALGGHGMIVYVTGREAGASTAEAGALARTADEVTKAGGQGVAFTCDHRDAAQVEALFRTIDNAHGCLDILVNNATAVHPELAIDAPFWVQPLHMSDMIEVGLRTSYVASYYAAPMMIRRPGGLIASISFYGGVCYFHGPGYGAAKAGTDKMAYDMAVDLAPHGVASVSLWPGFIMTELFAAIKDSAALPGHIVELLPGFETPDFTGHVIAGLHRDPGLMALSGQTLIVAELAKKYGVKDQGEKSRPDYRVMLGAPRSFPPIKS